MKRLTVVLMILAMTTPALAEPGIHVVKEPGKIATLKDLEAELPEGMGTFRFYGKERFRWSFWDYAQSAPFNNEYDYFSNQLRLGSRFENSLFKAHAAWQYTSLWNLPTGSSAGAGAGASYFSNGILENNSHATYLKYLELTLKDIFGVGFSPTIGRFEYSSGYQYKTGQGLTDKKTEGDTPEAKRLDWLKSKRIAERVIGGFDWSEYQRSFDGIKASWDTQPVNLSVAAMSPTQGGFEEKAGSGIEDIRIVATEFTIKKDRLLTGTELQFFHYHYEDARLLTVGAARPDNTARVAAAGLENDINLDMVGGHVAGALALGDGILDVLFWGGWQTGEWFELDHDAYALAAEVGYQWNTLPWKPWVRGGYDLASGDGSASDTSHDTFYPMLPTARLYSSSILYSSMNLEDIFLTLTVKPCSVISVKTDAHFLSLAERSDRWYLGSGPMNRNKLTDYTTRSSNGNDDLGILWDLTMTWDIHPDTTISAYYGHLFGGDVVQSFYTGQKDVNFFYLELAVNF